MLPPRSVVLFGELYYYIILYYIILYYTGLSLLSNATIMIAADVRVTSLKTMLVAPDVGGASFSLCDGHTMEYAPADPKHSVTRKAHKLWD